MAAEKTVICYGDSNTYGFDPRMGCPERLPRRVRWTGRLDALPGLRIINEGMNGREIPHTAAAFCAAFSALDGIRPSGTFQVVHRQICLPSSSLPTQALNL
jgi:hypothetical protein